MRLRTLASASLKGTLAVLAAGVVLWAVHPWPIPLRWLDPSTTAYMEHRERQARARGEPFELRWNWVALEELPSNLTRAVLIGEDHRFREHRGVDWEALAEEADYRGPLPPNPLREEDRAAVGEAIRYVREHRDQVRGRSTLTQQLARNLYLSPDRSFVRKAQEFLTARRLEFFLSKDRILELYLNVVELGPGIFGVEAASQAYFGASARELSARQAATLAATLPHPLTSNPEHAPGRMAWRRDLILERLTGGDPAEPVPRPVEVVPPSLPEPVQEPVPSPEPVDTLPAPIPPDTPRTDTIRPDRFSSPARGPRPATAPWEAPGLRWHRSPADRTTRAIGTPAPGPGAPPEPAPG